jgi:hypothetical protein
MKKTHIIASNYYDFIAGHPGGRVAQVAPIPSKIRSLSWERLLTITKRPSLR